MPRWNEEARPELRPAAPALPGVDEGVQDHGLSKPVPAAKEAGAARVPESQRSAENLGNREAEAGGKTMN